jgi:hypothetical protein
MLDIGSQLTQRVPYHNRIGVTQWWAPPDTEELWRHNMHDPVIRDYFESQGWHHERGIEYRLNHWGFRGDEFTATGTSLVVLGCSFTMGIGLREDQTWPWILADKLGAPCYNLAWGGGSADRCFRLAEFWLPKLQPKWCVMLSPPSRRLELLINDEQVKAESLGPTQSHDRYTKIWMTVDENQRINLLKNQLAIKALADHLGIPIWIYSNDEITARSLHIPLGHPGRARDLQHAGPDTQRSFAQHVAEDIHRS